MKNIVMIILIIVIVIVGNLALFFFLNQPTQTRCTLLAKICADGSTVGQNPDNDCAFDPCPEIQYCDANTQCATGDCYKFENAEKPYCFTGDPCMNCPSGECTVLESYPMQIRCGDSNTEEKTIQEKYDDLISSCQIAGMDSEACMKSSSIYDEYKDWCESQGGYFGQLGLMPVEYCDLPTSDGGKECADDADCEGVCLATLTEDQDTLLAEGQVIHNVTGKCADHQAAFGCRPVIINGTVEYEMCID